MKALLVTLFTVMIVLLGAQGYNPYGSLRHSSVDASGNIHLRWQGIAELTGDSQCFYRTGSGAWSSATPTEPEFGTLEALLPYSFGQRLRYRLHFNTITEEGVVSLLHAAYFDTDSFPLAPTSMALIGTDPEGDMLGTANPNLDIRETYVAATANKLYFSIKNVSGLYPTMNSFTSYNGYMCNIINGESALADSLTYAMVYASVPIVLPNGLYKVGYDAVNQLPIFTRLANIQAQVSGGVLHLACNISDLTNDPDFGAWPNEYNGLAFTASTISVAVSPELSIDAGDYGNPAAVIFIDNVYEVSANSLPVCTEPSYDSFSGVFSIQYSDAEGDFPLVAEVQTDDGTVYPASTLDYLFDGTEYMATLAPAYTGSIHWRFSDNGVDYTSGEYNPSSLEDAAVSPTPIICQMQNPYNGSMAITLKGLERKAAKVDLFNVRGQKLASLFNGIPSETEQSLQLDSSYASGIYFLRVQQGDRCFNHKFVITK